jgi:Rieske Fe-S protein
VDRRRFLSTVTLAASAALGVLLSVPLLGRLLGPLRGDGAAASGWRSIGPLTGFSGDAPTRVALPVLVQDGWVRKTTQQAAWVLRTGADAVRVFSTACPHLGCSVKWSAGAGHFECPCHESAFARDGDRLHGPARRGLDDLPVRVVGGEVEVRWVEFETGLAERRPLGGEPA